MINRTWICCFPPTTYCICSNFLSHFLQQVPRSVSSWLCQLTWKNVFSWNQYWVSPHPKKQLLLWPLRGFSASGIPQYKLYFTELVLLLYKSPYSYRAYTSSFTYTIKKRWKNYTMPRKLSYQTRGAAWSVYLEIRGQFRKQGTQHKWEWEFPFRHWALLDSINEHPDQHNSFSPH